MQKNSSYILVLGALACASSAFAALKYQTDSYVQDGLVVHLDGIRNVGAKRQHDSSAKHWENLANPTNPAAITSNASSGWRDDGYYFAWNSSTSYARLMYNVPAMTQATFEFACDNLGATQYTPSWGCTFFSGTNDQRVCTVDASTIRFKADQWTGSSNYRPSISSWSWKQASFTLGSSGNGNFKSYDSGTLKDSKSAGSTGVNTIPATQWMVASRIGQTDNARQFKGVMKSFRVYNRALTADEVKANAAVDAARFDGVMPVTNAVVATAVAGAFGNETPGVYAVDGSHTFTAPPSVKVGSTTYVCTGYKLEKWENGAWSSPVTVTGFAATVSETEKVRITWQWETTSATLGGYATDGLVVWLDGIWNIGLGKPHNSYAAEWANLADASNPAVITANDLSGWRNDGYYFCYHSESNKVSSARFAKNVPGMTRATFEMAFDGKLADQSAFDWGSYFIGVEANYGICGFDKNGKICLNKIGGSEGDYRVNFLWNWKQASFTLGESGASGINAYDEGAQMDSRSRSIKAIPAARWYIANYSNAQKYQAVGTMKAVRFYNRALSADEIAQNAVADEARFSSGTNGVEVMAHVRGLVGRAPAGFYVPNGWTFSAGTATQTAGGISYAPAGYIVETYDISTRTWSVSETSDSATTWTAPAQPFANRRLTWKWRAVKGIRSAADYGLDDYVQDGIVGWLDGICNAGANQPHNSAATTWVDLSVRKSGVQLTTNDASHWTDDGYYFCLGSSESNYKRSYAYLRQTLSLGETGTIEFSSDVDLTKKNPTGVDGYVGRFVSYVTGEKSGDFSDSCIRNQGDNQLEWNADNWSGTTWQNRVKTTPDWDGKHAAFVMATDSYTSFKAGMRDQSNERLSVVEMPKLYWMIGNKYNESWIANQLTGTMKALRLYSRPLSDAEVAQNYKVDAARFDGVLVDANVVVAGKYENYVGAAAGEYEVYGTHTFTAGAATDGNKVRPVVGYTIEAWDGSAWGEPVAHEGDSYTYTEGTDPAKVRLTWKWQPDGMMVIIR